MQLPERRGFFGIGAEGLSKAENLGALMRTAHAFGASFCFALGGKAHVGQTRATDTSDASLSLPFYVYETLADLPRPAHCRLVGIELTPDAVDLPAFYHPPAAIYILGPERGSLRPETLAACDHVVKIPTRFCINVSLAGALVMYDRMLATARLPERSLTERQPPQTPAAHVHGAPKYRRGGAK